MLVLPGACLAIYNAVVMKIYMDTFLEHRERKWEAAGWLLFVVWQTVVNSRIWVLTATEVMYKQNPGLNLFINLVTMELVGICSYRGRVWKRVIFPIIYCALWMLAEGLVLFGTRYLSLGELSMTGYLLVSNAVVLLMTLGIRQFAQKKGIIDAPYESNILILFPLAGIILYYAIYKMAKEAGAEKTEVMLWLFISALMLFALDLCIYPIYGKLTELFWTKRNNNEYLKQIELYKNQRELEQSAREELERIKHDLKSNLVYLGNLLKHQEYEKMQQVLAALLGEIHEKSYLEGRTGNLAIDSQINFLWQESQKQSICLHMDVKLPNVPNIDDTDICVLLGNIFDNAIEASEKIPQSREIWVELSYNRGYFRLYTKNRYDGKIIKGNRGMPKSNKEGWHGFGIRSIEKIVNKYQGHIEIEEKEDIFEIEVSLYCE